MLPEDLEECFVILKCLEDSRRDGRTLERLVHQTFESLKFFRDFAASRPENFQYLIGKLKKWKNALASELSRNLEHVKYLAPTWNTDITETRKMLRVSKAMFPSIHPSNTIPQILCTLMILDFDDHEFKKVIQSFEWYPSIGMMICGILFDNELNEKARQFLEDGSKRLGENQEIVLQFMKKNLTNCRSTTILHFVSACGDCIKSIVPDEMSLSPWLLHADLSAIITKVVSSSSLIKMAFRNCSLDSKSVADIKYELNDTGVKIHSLDISKNTGIDVNGYRLLGDIVKKHAVQQLHMTWCDLTFEKLCSFKETSGESEILHLDISGNKDISVKGYYCLGEIAEKHRIKRLEILGNEITAEKVIAYNMSRYPEILLDFTVDIDIDAQGYYCLSVIDNFTKMLIDVNIMVEKVVVVLEQRLSIHRESFDSLWTAICKLSLNVSDHLEVRGLLSSNLSKDAAHYENIRWIAERLVMLNDFIRIHSCNSLRITFTSSKTIEIFSDESSETFALQLERLPDFQMLVLSESEKNWKGVMDEKQFDELDLPMWTTDQSNVKEEIAIITMLDGHIKLMPMETRILIYKQRFPSLQWDSLTGSGRAWLGNFSIVKGVSSVVSSLESFEKIGPGGGRIEVGDCFVEFQPGTFENDRCIKITANVDHRDWPGHNVISPVLDVNVGQIKKAAKVHLSTWAVPETKCYVDIMHYSRDTGEWEFIRKRCRLGRCRFIEFQCSDFSGILAKLANVLSLPIAFAFRPSCYVYNHQFIVALHLDDASVKNGFAKLLDEQFGGKVKQKLYHPVHLRKSRKLDVRLYCSIPESGFLFEPPGQFTFQIDGGLINGDVFYQECTLYSESCENRAIVIRFDVGRVGRLEPNSFEYHWHGGGQAISVDPKCRHPLDGMHCSDTSGTKPNNQNVNATLSSSHTDSKPPSHQISLSVEVNVDNKKSITAQNVIQGGNVHQTSRNCEAFLGGTDKK